MKAEQEKKIQIEQAKAELESATLRAKAIEIVGEASKKYPEYRTQEFIGAIADAMSNGKIEKIIYVPTVAQLVEQVYRKHQVASSNLVIGSK